MRVFLCDPGLTSQVGHHFTLNRNIADAFRRRGLETLLLVDQQIDRAVATALDAIPWFARVPFDPADFDPLCGWMENFLDCAAALQADLDRLGAGRDDLLVCHSACHRQLLAVADWLRPLPEAARPTVVLMFGGNGGVGRSGTVQTPAALCFRYAARRLPRDSAAVILAAQDEAPARSHRFLFNRPVTVVPTPYDGRPRRRQRPALIGFLGHQRPDKGISLFADLILGLKTGPHRQLEILVQDSGPDSWADGTMNILGALGAELHHQVGYEQWPALVDRIDVLMLPYDPESGGANHSTLATEAAAFGIPAVVPAGSGVADFMERYNIGHQTFDQWTKESILAALDRLLAQYPAHAEQAYQAALRWRAGQGASALAGHLLALHDQRR